MSSANPLSRGRKRRAESPPPKTRNTKRAKTARPSIYSHVFECDLLDNGIFLDGYEYPDGQIPEPPSNWEDIMERLSRPRPSLFSKFGVDSFRKFKRADTNAAKEHQVMMLVIPVIEGERGDLKCVGGDYIFGNLAPLFKLRSNESDKTNRLEPAQAKPDRLYGARPEQLNRRIRDELCDQIIPSTQDSLPMLPNFFLEVKGPNGTAIVAARQACYAGAIGARGMRALQTYLGDKTRYGRKVHTITSTYVAGQLKIYAHHIIPTKKEDRDSEYIMTQLKGYSMTSDRETFVRGASAYRNLRDWAKEQRNELIRDANERLRKHIASKREAISELIITVDDVQTSSEIDERPFYDAVSSFSDTTVESIETP